MNEVSVFRLYLLRAGYVLIAVGMGIQIWPGIFNPPADLEHYRSVVRALMGALTLLAALGVRYPIKMLPLLLFELAWKTIWVLAFGLPRWMNNTLDVAYEETLFACLVGVIFIVIIPWPYVWKHYVRAPSDRWKPSR